MLPIPALVFGLGLAMVPVAILVDRFGAVGESLTLRRLVWELGLAAEDGRWEACAQGAVPAQLDLVNGGLLTDVELARLRARTDASVAAIVRYDQGAPEVEVTATRGTVLRTAAREARGHWTTGQPLQFSARPVPRPGASLRLGQLANHQLLAGLEVLPCVH